MGGEPGGALRSWAQSPGRWPAVVSLVLASVVAAPLFGAGHPLRYDLVSVPRQVLTADSLGLGDRLPRAVPLDLLTAAYGAVLPWPAWPGPVLLLALVAAGTGCARLVPAGPAARVVAAAVAVWNPWVAERLSIGHVPLLLAYGAMPWIVGAAARAASGRAGPVPVVLWSALACTTPAGAVLAGAAWTTGTAATLRRGGRRAAALGGMALVVLNLPWVVAGALHPGVRATAGGPEGARAFALRAEAGTDPWTTALSLGGLWNAAAVPDSRTTVLVPLGAAVLGACSVVAVVLSLRAGRHRAVLACATAFVLAVLLAVLPAVVPFGGAVGRMMSTLPGAGLLRDSHRWGAVLAVCVAGAAGTVFAAAVRRARARAPVGAAAALAAVVLAVSLVPDLAWGVAGRVTTRQLPADWSRAADLLDGRQGRVVSLPWQPFRRFDWAGSAPVLDPAPRILDVDVLVSDDLVVDGVALGPESLLSAQVAALVADGVLDREDLDRAGVRWVLVQRGTPGSVPHLAPADVVLEGEDLLLLDLGPGPAPTGPGTTRVVAVLAAWAAWAGLLAWCAVAGTSARWRTYRTRARNRSAST